MRFEKTHRLQSDILQCLCKESPEKIEQGLQRLERRGFSQTAKVFRRLLLERKSLDTAAQEWGGSRQEARKRLAAAEVLLWREMHPEITRWLAQWHKGDVQARDQLWEHKYTEFRRRAAARSREGCLGGGSGPTSIVDEAFRRLEEAVCKRRKQGQEVLWKSRGHFEAYVEVVMANLIRERLRRSKVRELVGEDQANDAPSQAPPVESSSGPLREEVVDLRAALAELQLKEPIWHAALLLMKVEGRTIAETAAELGIAERSVKRYQKNALAFLNKRMTDERGDANVT